jgi:hypothetical protein
LANFPPGLDGLSDSGSRDKTVPFGNDDDAEVGHREAHDELVHEVPAMVGCKTPSALAHAAGE